MAIYHFSMKTVSRSKGRSAVAAAAYRSGQKLEDHYYGLVHDYTKKSGIELAQIFTPNDCSTSIKNRQDLWNTAEKAEKRSNSTIAREFEIAFPQELNQAQRKAMLIELCEEIVKRHGVVVDACIHAPHSQGGTDDRNFHAHVLMTTRQATPEGLGKKTRELDDRKSGEVQWWRAKFAELTNSHLEKAGHDVRVDHRSYKDQGIDREAKVHEGPATTALRRKGLENEIIASNNLIQKRNDIRAANENSIQEYYELAKKIDAAELAIKDRDREKNNLEDCYQTYWDFQKIYENFLVDFNATDGNKAEQAQVIKDHNFTEHLESFKKASLVLRQEGIEPTRPPEPSLLAKLSKVFKKQNVEAEAVPFVTFSEMQSIEQEYFTPIFQYIEQARKSEKKRLEEEKRKAKESFEREQREEIARAEKSRQKALAVEEYFRNFDKTGLAREFDNELGFIHKSRMGYIGMMTQLQAQSYVENDFKEFNKYTKEKYELIEDLIPKLNAEDLKLIKKIIDTDKSVTGVDITVYTDKATKVLEERKQDLEWRSTKQETTYTPSPTSSKRKNNDHVFSLK